MYPDGNPMSPEEEHDYAVADEELRTTRLQLYRVQAAVSRSPPIPLMAFVDPSVFLADLRVQAAERVVVQLREHYQRLRGSGNGNGGDTDDTTPAVEGSSGGPSPGPPAYSLTLAVSDEDEVELVGYAPNSQGLATPTRALSQEGGATPTRPATPPCAQPVPVTPTRGSSRQHLAAPTTPLNCSFVGKKLGSPFKNKHYSITVGRRIGIFPSWLEAAPFVNGRHDAVYQGFDTYDDALTHYFRARENGSVRVSRGVEDTDEKWGPVHLAEYIHEDVFDGAL